MDAEQIAELRAFLEGLEAFEAKPEDGPVYLHELIQRPSTLIEFMRLHLPPEGS